MKPNGQQTSDLLDFERSFCDKGYVRIAGVDEAGRGPLAGPVVVAAVVLPRDKVPSGINDSKQLTAAQREVLFAELTAAADIAVAVIDVETIDRINILRATHQGMRKAVAQLSCAPDHVLIDGLPIGDAGFPYTALVKGDSRSASIAAASIIAKVTRDRLMIEYDSLYPEYGFAGHKGYYCDSHVAAIRKHGPCPIHRKSFDPVKTMLQQRSFEF